MKVQFLKKYLNYVAGQFYTIDPKLAKGLIAYGVCIEVKEEIAQPKQIVELKKDKKKK